MSYRNRIQSVLAGTLLLCSFSLLALEHSLSFSIALDQLKINKQIIELYKSLLAQSLNKEVVYSANSKTADVVITSDLSKQDGLHRSFYFVGQVPAFIRVTRKGESQDEFSIIDAQVKGAIRLDLGHDEYLVDSSNLAVTLLNNRRINSLIDTYSNAAIYRVNNNEFDVVKLNVETPIVAQFRDAAMLALFDKNSSTIVTEWDLKQPVADKVDEVGFYLLYKYHNQKTGKFEVLDNEKMVVKWFAQKLPHYNIQQQETNTANGFASIREKENICLINVIKTSKRAKLAHFSQPTIAFLPRRLYALNNSPSHHLLAQYEQGQSSINIDKFLATQKNLLIGYTGYYFERFPKPLQQIIKSNQQSFVDLGEMSNVTGLQMLDKERISLLLEYPSVIAPSKQLLGSNAKYVSFGIEDLDTSPLGHIACSKSSLGSQLIADINNLMLKDKVREEMLSILNRTYTQSAKTTSIQNLNNLYNNLVSTE